MCTCFRRFLKENFSTMLQSISGILTTTLRPDLQDPKKCHQCAESRSCVKTVNNPSWCWHIFLFLASKCKQAVLCVKTARNLGTSGGGPITDNVTVLKAKSDYKLFYIQAHTLITGLHCSKYYAHQVTLKCIPLCVKRTRYVLVHIWRRSDYRPPRLFWRQSLTAICFILKHIHLSLDLTVPNSLHIK